jgi:hypothetical protein
MSVMNLILFGACGALMAIAAAFLKGRSDGVRIERARQTEAERATRALADSVDDSVSALPPAAARKELKRWSRG